MAILLRTDKGSKLTYLEADENFSSLFYSASISGNTLSLYYTGSSLAPSINPININIPTGESYWTASLAGLITRTSNVGITGNLQVIGQITGSVLRLSSLPQGTTETKILVADGSGNVRFRTDLQLQGTQGIQGFTGAQGIQGMQGTRGIQGIQGLQGVEGDEGVQGIQGIQGPQGTQGIQGLQGRQGTQGIQGPQGVQGTQGIQGIQGIQGLQGIQGPQGTQGIQGPQGTQGIQGVQGLQGIQGPQGTQGIQGTQGVQGIQGLQGRQGTQGLQGTQGTQGIQGFVGQTGLGFLIAKVYSSVAALEADTAPTDIVSGEFAIITTADPNNVDNSRLYLWDGYVYTYINDLSGAAGIQGVQGIQGLSVQGIQGITGIQGDLGIQGIQGITGAGIQGPQGLQGLQGNGIQGIQGVQGPEGPGTNIAHLEYSNTDLTVWNNGKGNLSNNTSFGEKALSNITTGDYNAAYGYRALQATTTANGNTAAGWQSLKNNTTGNENTAYGNTSLYDNTTGELNTAIGGGTLASNITGVRNTAIGYGALNITRGSLNTSMGSGAGMHSSGSSSKNLYLGFQAGPSIDTVENDKLYIANAQGTPLIGGDFAAQTVTIAGSLGVTGNVTAAGFFNSSDRRLKSIIRRDGDVAYYRWLDNRDTKEHIGYIAQEQQQKHPDQVGTDGEFLTVNYTEILVAKVRELEKEIELLKSRL